MNLKIRLLYALVMMLVLAGWTSFVRARFIDAGYGPRPAGMGEAFVSLADDAQAALSNPAGFSQIDNIHLTYMYADLFSGLTIQTEHEQADPTGYHFLAAALPVNKQIGYFGLAWLRLVTALYQEDTMILSYARRIGQGRLFQKALDISTGISAKALGWHVDMGDASWYGIASTSKWNGTLDAGLLITWSDHWRFGMTLDNLVPVDMGLLEEEVVTSIWRVGLSYQYQFSRLSYLDSILGIIEYNQRADKHHYKAGIETWWFNQTVSLRAGINADQATSGLSYVYQLPGSPLLLQLDYAYALPFQVYQSTGTHRVGLTLIRDASYWAKKDKREKAIELRKNREEDAVIQAVNRVSAGQTIARLSNDMTSNALQAEASYQALMAAVSLPEIEEYLNYAGHHIRLIAKQSVTVAQRGALRSNKEIKRIREQTAINQLKLYEVIEMSKLAQAYAVAAQKAYTALDEKERKGKNRSLVVDDIKLEYALEEIADQAQRYKKRLAQSYALLDEIQQIIFKIKEDALGSQKFSSEMGLNDCSELLAIINQHANKADQALLEAAQVLKNKIATSELIQQAVSQARSFKINQTDAIHIGFERRYLSAFYDFAKMSRMIGQVTEYIKEWTGYDLNVVEYIYSEDLKTDFLAGRLDLVISDNQSFKDFYQTKTAEPLVTFIMNKKDYQNEWLFYQKTEPRQAISDFKNKRIGFLNPNSLAYLKQNVAGYQIDYFKEFKRIHDAKSAVLALCLKEVDAVVASGYLLNVYDRVETAAPKTLEKIVLPGSMIPNPPIYRRTMMNQSKLKLINQFMKKMKEVEVESSVQQFFNFLKIDGIDKFEIQKYKKYY